MKNEKLRTFTDGGARGNPGPAACGVVVKGEERVLVAFGEYLGKTTNNIAEYTAVLRALETARDLGAREVDCYLDAELVVKQMRGEYRVKNPGLAPLYLQIWTLVHGFQRVSFHHIPRERNTEADRQVNLAIDRALGIRKKP